MIIKKKPQVVYNSMKFRDLSSDNLLDIGVLSSAFLEAGLSKIKLWAQYAIIDTGLARNFEIMLVNGQLDEPVSKKRIRFEFVQFQHGIVVVPLKPSKMVN